MLTRASGVLLHPTSLPGPFGIGEFNDNAYKFVDTLVETGQTLWQVLPLGPTGYGDSPYQCFSAFAGNPLLISLEHLVRDGALAQSDLAGAPSFAADRVNYGDVIDFKFDVLARSYVHFTNYANDAEQKAFAAFSTANAAWLDDYALFMALKEAHDGEPWVTWEDDIARRTPKSMARWRKSLDQAIQTQKYFQYQFFKQWNHVRTYASSKGVKIIGDIPIFVAYDSADAWSNRELFYFDERGNPEVVAGVPPDYFSPTGQRWGNPLYRWDVMHARGYDWWVDRLRAALKLYDVVRIDHFRGFESYWEVPSSEPTAMKGRWVKGPDQALFKAIGAALGGDLPIIAEDLGVITPEVEALRDGFNLPGMKVLQFAFVADTSSAFLPHNYIPNCVAYAGTHDNDTTVGWWKNLDEPTRAQVRAYTGTDGSDIQWDMIRLLEMSVANTVVVTLQDVLGLGSDTRMNFPGRADGNWYWRFGWDQLTPEIKTRLTDMTRTYGRAPAKP
jgi:4-alpha-glucanotransferase